MAVTGTGTGIFHMTAGGDVAGGPMIIVSCRWVGATTAGHQCVLQDLKLNRLFSSEANGANFTDGWAFDNKWVDGVSIATMDSGAIDLYLARR
jgi:hypothetical protein